MEYLKYYELVRENNSMSLVEFLEHKKFEISRFPISLDFWLDLNSINDNDMFVITDELINLICKTDNKVMIDNNRANLLSFIKKKFTENEDFLEEKKEIKIKKRVFKMTLLMIRTQKSKEIYDYLLDLENITTQYVFYQKECSDYNLFLLTPRQKTPSSVFYMLELYDFPYIKFGKSSNVARCLDSHRTNYGLFDIIVYHNCIDMDKFETEFKTELNNNNICTDFIINDKSCTDLIPKSYRELAMNVYNRIIENERLVNEHEVRLTEEHVYMIRIKKIEKEIELKKFEKEIELKKMDLELKKMDNEIELKRIDKEFEIEKYKIDKQYDKKSLIENNNNNKTVKRWKN